LGEGGWEKRSLTLGSYDRKNNIGGGKKRESRKECGGSAATEEKTSISNLFLSFIWPAPIQEGERVIDHTPYSLDTRGEKTKL